MKKLFGSLFLKMIAFVIVCIATPILIGCAWCATEAYDEGFYYGKKAEYENSSSCLWFVADNLAEVREYIYWNDIQGLIESEFYFDHKNFAYTIYDMEGNVVLTTLRSTSGEPEIHKPDEEGSTGYIEITDKYPAREVTETGEVIAEYEMTGYIRMPLDPNYDGYADYANFVFIAENKDLFINVGLLCFGICAVLCLYLIVGAGKDENGELELRGLNAVDYDIMVFLYAGGIAALYTLASNIRWAYDDIYKVATFGLVFAAATGLTLVMLLSTSAHLKMKKWWHHTIIWQCVTVFGRFMRWFLNNIGFTWKLALGVAGYSILMFLFGVLSTDYGEGIFAVFFAVFSAMAAICAAVWFGVQLKKIKKGSEAIAGGNFDYRVNSRELWPGLRGYAYNLNSAALGMSKAVDDRIKSERFKTELITNVSHDLKTPLTSIVSYVDLLKKEDIQNETAMGYIEVIDRQSAKLKKLTEDLIEASKASSGAVAVDKEVLNIGELVNQSVGEFSEKLEAAEISPVVNLPEEEVAVYTDGRLLWRVFENLIQNIIKYAQPGTRAYFDITKAQENAVITFRNISKEPLNMSAEALMERFVRGDASRNSEGNGLGLSIAKSLTELCGGTFELMLDGDLYKVIITLPRIIPESEPERPEG